ncbi:MAG: sensor histidine kinase [Adhaeribacter sp.]
MKKTNPALLIALLYFLVGALWIFLTDKFTLQNSPDTRFFHVLQTYKGILYMLLSSVGLFWLIRRLDFKLREQGKEYEVLFEENPNPMWVVDMETLFFLAVNRAALEQYGYSKEEFLTMTPAQIRPDEDQKAFLEAWQQPIETYQAFGRWRMLRKSGEIVVAEVYRHKVQFRGRPASLHLILDITGRIRAEEDRNKLIQELTNQNLDLQQFAYITSHNLRAPIANIMGLVNLYAVDNPPAFNQEIINKLGASARNLDTVVRDLNDLLVIRTRRNEEMQLIDLEKALVFTRQGLNAEMSASLARIDSDFSRAPELMSVRSYVLSMLYNLLSNAIKYRSPERPLQVVLRSYPLEKNICLEVRDNGLGIDLEKNQQKVFGMYQRFHKEIEGKGLGLHLVKTQVEALGGRIGVESQPGEGTTFKLYFPARQAYNS